MNKIWEKEAWRIEHEEDATITFSIALHGEHAWEMLLENRDRYHSIGHGWATDSPRDWEEAIAPALRRLFVNGRLDFAKPNSSSNRSQRSDLGFASDGERQAVENPQSMVVAAE
jgi:hypothetical protein